MELQVECALAPDGTVEPRTVWFGSRRVEVRAVADRWYGQDQRWWKVETDEGVYVVRRDERTGAWDLAAVVRSQD